MKKIILLLLLFACCYVKAKAQFVYTNEACGGAVPLVVSNNSILIDTLYLGDEYADNNPSTIPLCNGSTNVRRDLWYRFIATDTALSIVSMSFPVNTSLIRFQIFSGNCSSLTSLACYNSGINTRLSNLTPGQEYYLRAYNGNPGSDVFSYALNIISKPANDDCDGAVALPIWDANTQGSKTTRCTNDMATLTATGCDQGIPSGWQNLEDVWYKFTATAASHTVKINVSRGPNTKALIYRGQPGNFTAVEVFNFSNSVVSLVRTLTNLVPGESYYIRVGSVDPIDFSVAVFGTPPLNDDCINADTVLMSNSFSCENNFIISNRLTATISAGGCSSIDNDVWFVFKATATAVTVRGTAYSGSLQFGILQGTCGALSCLINSSSNEFTYSGLTAGNYYYLQVGGTRIENPATICISPAVANDDCSGAVSIPVKPYGELRSTLAYVGNATQSMPYCAGGSGTVKDIWYKFTAADTACLVTIDGGGSFEMLSGTCAALSSIHCSSGVALPLGSAERTEKVTGLVAGNIYYLRVMNASSGSTNMFSIDVNALPSNDECAGAHTLIPQSRPYIETVKDNGILKAAQSQAPCAATPYSNDVWYKFVAAESSAAVISHSPTGSAGVSVKGMQLYSGACGGLSSIRCLPLNTAQEYAVQTISNLTPGNTYYIRQYGNLQENTISVLNAPANDEITGAIQLYPSAAGAQPLPSYYTHAASRQFGKICSSSPAAMDHDVWFYFVASQSSHTVSTVATNSFWEEQTAPNYRIETFRGFATDSLSLSAKLISCGNNAVTLSGLTTGDTIYVRVAAMANGTTAVFSMKVSDTQSIDEPSGALLLAGHNDYEYAITTSGATQSLPAAGCVITDYPDDDVWFKFYAAPGNKRIVAGKENYDVTLQLFSGTPGNLTPVLCSNNIMLLPASLSNGTLYFVRAYSKENARVATFSIGLFGDGGIEANSCDQDIAALGPNLVSNAACESDEIFLVPSVTRSAGSPGKKLAEGWWSTTSATPDPWNADYPLATAFGNVPDDGGYGTNKIPRSGKGMLGILNEAEWTEYVTGKLKQPLTAGKTYFVSFYISFTKSNGLDAFNIGALFSNDSTRSGTDALQVTPQVSVAAGATINARNTWYNVCGYFYADKAYSYITIGNFGDRAIYGSVTSTYMFLDDVFVAQTDQEPLPLQLLSFNGRMNAEKQNELYWVTAGENNTSHFEVESHTGNGPFKKIGNVPAAGYSNGNKSYYFLHTNPEKGHNYYRLKMFDRDGQFKYSPVVSIGAGEQHNLAVYPNPVSHTLNITAFMKKQEMVLFKILDSYGRIVATRQRLLQKGSNAFSWDISALPAGNYFMQSAGKEHTTVKLIKR